jgi:hypothetical protein
MVKEKKMMSYDSKNWQKQIEIDGVSFKIGYQKDTEFSGPVFEMKKHNRYYGALMVAFGCGTELGFDSGIHATENEILAAKKALTILKGTKFPA